MRYVNVELPNTINTIAVPTDWFGYFLSEKNGMPILVIRKNRPESEEFVAGARHRFAFRLEMLPRGGIRLENKDFTVRKGAVGEVVIKTLYRKLRYAEFKIEGYGSALRVTAENMEELKKKAEENLREFQLVDTRGYIVFERMNNNEWKLTRKEPEAYIYVKSYELRSRSGCAEYRILRTKNVLKAVTDATATAVLSVTAMLLILSTSQPAWVEYIAVDCPYRGVCKELVATKRIDWNNGNPQEVEEPFPGEDLEVI